MCAILQCSVVRETVLPVPAHIWHVLPCCTWYANNEQVATRVLLNGVMCLHHNTWLQV
jgi:hypothetical protein